MNAKMILQFEGIPAAGADEEIYLRLINEQIKPLVGSFADVYAPTGINAGPRGRVFIERIAEGGEHDSPRVLVVQAISDAPYTYRISIYLDDTGLWFMEGGETEVKLNRVEEPTA